MDGRGGPPGTPAALYAAETWSEPAFTLLSADPVAGAAAVTLGRELLLAGEGDAGLAHLHGLRVAPVAGHLGREHPRRGVRDALRAGPHVHLLLVVVEPLVAGVALDLEGLDHLDLAVPDLLVAFQALDRVAGDVDPVEGERVGLPVQPAHVAVVAMGVVDPAVPPPPAEGAVIARHPDLQVGLVGEPEAGVVHGPGGRAVAPAGPPACHRADRHSRSGTLGCCLG